MLGVQAHRANAPALGSCVSTPDPQVCRCPRLGLLIQLQLSGLRCSQRAHAPVFASPTCRLTPMLSWPTSCNCVEQICGCQGCHCCCLQRQSVFLMSFVTIQMRFKRPIQRCGPSDAKQKEARNTKVTCYRCVCVHVHVRGPDLGSHAQRCSIWRSVGNVGYLSSLEHHGTRRKQRGTQVQSGGHQMCQHK
jgi:hypothetical protein